MSRRSQRLVGIIPWLALTLVGNIAKADGKFDGRYEGNGVGSGAGCNSSKIVKVIKNDTFVSSTKNAAGAMNEAKFPIGADGKFDGQNGYLHSFGQIADGKLNFRSTIGDCIFTYELKKTE